MDATTAIAPNGSNHSISRIKSTQARLPRRRAIWSTLALPESRCSTALAPTLVVVRRAGRPGLRRSNSPPRRTRLRPRPTPCSAPPCCCSFRTSFADSTRSPLGGSCASEREGASLEEAFHVDGTLIEAWASQKSFQKKKSGPHPPCFRSSEEEESPSKAVFPHPARRPGLRASG